MRLHERMELLGGKGSGSRKGQLAALQLLLLRYAEVVLEISASIANVIRYGKTLDGTIYRPERHQIGEAREGRNHPDEV